MKDIKSYIIGFLTCACLFLVMGQGKMGGNGRYQLSVNQEKDINRKYLVDTATGELFYLMGSPDGDYWEQFVEPNSFGK